MGIIGNFSYTAYIDKTSNVKWLYLPKFDSRFIIGLLLDEEIGGEFSIKSTNVYFSAS